MTRFLISHFISFFPLPDALCNMRNSAIHNITSHMIHQNQIRFLLPEEHKNELFCIIV